MADLKETARWEAGIYQWETSDPVMGGENGIDNLPTRQLANRTVWLKEKLEEVQRQAEDKLPLEGGTATGRIAVRYNHDWVGFAAEQPAEGKNVFFDGIVGNIARGGFQVAALGNGRYEARILVTPEGATDRDRRIAGMTITDKHIHTAAYGNLHDHFAAKTDLQRVADGKTDNGHRHSIADIDNLQAALNGKFSVAGGNVAGSIAIRTGTAGTWQGVAMISSANAYFEKRRENNIALGGLQVFEQNDGSAGVKLQATPAGETNRDRRVDVLVGNGRETTVHHNGHRTVFEADGSIRVLDNRSQTVWHSVHAVAPSGQIAYFSGGTVPHGWLKANGAAVSRTAYAALFAAIGTTYGEGDGHSTFNLPDLRGEFVRGFDDGRGVDAGRVFGSSQNDAVQQFSGTIRFKEMIGGTPSDGIFSTENTPQPRTFREAGGGFDTVVKLDASTVIRTAHETRPHNIALLACIKI